MKNEKTILGFLAFIILLLVGCKKDYIVEFAIQNDSSRSISVVYGKSNQGEVDSNFISYGKRLIFLIERGNDKSPQEYISKLSELPIEVIRINDLEGNKLKCNEKDINCWEKFSSGEKKGIGTVTLRIKENSFE